MKYIFSSFIIIFLTVVNYYNSTSLKSPEISYDVNEKHLALNFDLVSLLCLGQKRMCSSLLWTDTMLHSDIERTNNKNKSWMYYRYRLISHLDPFFYSNYLIGGIYLSVVKDEPENAKKLYEDGLKQYQEDFSLNLNAAFNDYYELGLADEAITKYQRAYNNTEDPLVKRSISNIISKLSAGTGKLEFAFDFLYAQYKVTLLPSIKAEIGEQLYAIKAEIDLACLNKKERKNCSDVDFFGLPYLYKNGSYEAKREWKPFRIKKKETK